MKAEERKRLETNVLADRMGRLVRDVRRGPSRRGVLIGIAILLVASVVVGYFYLRNVRSRRQAETWQHLYHGSIASLTQGVLSEDPDKKKIQTKCAEMQLAWVQLWEQGISKLFAITDLTAENPSPSGQVILSIMDAEKTYDRVYTLVQDDPVLAAEALYYLGVARETLAIRDPKNLDSARQVYQKLAESSELANTAYGKRAKKRLDLLNDSREGQRIRAFYDRLHQAYVQSPFGKANEELARLRRKMNLQKKSK